MLGWLLAQQDPSAQQLLEQYTRNKWYFYAAYTLVWVLLLLYLVRLHLMIRDLGRRQAELDRDGGDQA